MLGREKDAKLSPSKLSSLVLTSERLLAVPKRNLHDYLSNYVRDQRNFIKDYSQDYEPQNIGEPNEFPPSAFPVGDASKDTAFGTPILKSRVPTSSKAFKRKLNDCSRAGTNTLGNTKSVVKTANEGTLDLTNKNKDREDNQATIRYQRRDPSVGKGAAKHAAAQENYHDDDHIKRLEERRQKKRARKVTMLPAKGVNDVDDNPSSKMNYDRTNKKSQPKDTQLGFTLLHRFSATNVGKNRLTLDPLSHGLGVFKKGKASTKTRVKGKRKGDDSVRLFSEAKFLNPGTSDARKYLHVDDSSTSSTISSRSIRNSPRKHRGVSQEGADRKKIANSSKHSDEDLTGRRYNPDDSIIWDIEKGSDAMSEADSNDRQGTILIKYNRPVATPTLQGSSKKTSSYVSRMSLESSNKSIGRDMSPLHAAANELSSLAPSESASQLLSNQHTTINDRSKYFHCIEKPAILARSTSANNNSGLPNDLERRKPHYLNDFDYVKPVSERRTSNVLDTWNPRDTEEGNHPTETLDDIQTSRTQDVPSGTLLVSPTYLSTITYEFDPPELDLTGCSGANEHMEDLSVFQLSPQSIYDLHDFQLRNIVRSEDNSDDISFFPLLGDCVWNTELSCSNTIDGKTSESLDTPSYFLNCAGHVVEHDPNIEDCHCRLCADCGITEPENYDGDRYATHSGSNAHPDDYTNPNHSGAASPDQEEHQIDYFQQGRSLLYGHELMESRNFSKPTQLSNVEAEVAGALRLGHWLPQRL